MVAGCHRYASAVAICWSGVGSVPTIEVHASARPVCHCGWNAPFLRHGGNGVPPWRRTIPLSRWPFSCTSAQCGPSASSRCIGDRSISRSAVGNPGVAPVRNTAVSAGLTAVTCLVRSSPAGRRAPVWLMRARGRKINPRARVVNTVLIAAASLLPAACSVPPRWSTQTDYPVTVAARVAKRTGFLQHSPIPIMTASGELIRSKPRIDYELRANDGTVLIVQTTSEFPVGACVELSGYADGPSRTHFSFGRAKLEPSDRCQ